MAISMDLRVLARKLEKNSDDLLASASTKGPQTFEKVATAIAAASTLLESVADDMDENAEFQITAEQLDELVAVASAFDESNDPLLKKQASVLDDLLLSIAAPKNAARQARKVTDDEINRLRMERRKTRGEEAYIKPRQEHHDMWNTAAQAKAVEQQVKRYIPLEAPLQTRYPPDRPGGQMTRITDHVYQDITTGIIYDYKAGYTTQKGNKVPGGSVENQTRQLGDYRNQSTALFETRQSLMGRYAADGDFNHLKKYALGDQIAEALRAVRDQAPELMDAAIDHARDDGLNTTEVGSILGDMVQAKANLEICLAAAGWEDMLLPKAPANPKLNRESLVALALNAIQELAPHLLKAAVTKATEEGLTDQQVQSILGSGFRGKFDAPSFGEDGEIKAAEALLPHLKDLGWNDLAEHHLKVIADLGVSEENIQKLSGKKVSQSYRTLSNLLKNATPAAARELDFSDFGGDETPSASVMMGDEPEEPAPVPPPVTQAPAAKPKSKKAPQDLFTELFGDVSTPGGAKTPNDDLEGWLGAFEAAKQGIRQNPEAKAQLVALDKSQRDEALRQLINKEMNSLGFVGGFERNEAGVEYYAVAAKLTQKPKVKKAPKVQGATDAGKQLPWVAYQKKNKIVVPNAQAIEIEANIKDHFAKLRDMYNVVFSKYTYPGSDIPMSVKRLPNEIKSKLSTEFLKGELTRAQMDLLAKWIGEYEQTHAEKLIMPSASDLQKARKGWRGAENKALAEELRKRAVTIALQTSINLMLDNEDLPPMYPDAKVMTVSEFAKQMETLGKSEAAIAEGKRVKKVEERAKPRNAMIHPIPTDDKGMPLITLWDDPDQYLDALRMVQIDYPLPPYPRKPSRREKEGWVLAARPVWAKWDEEFKKNGLVPPGYKLFGSGAPWKGTTLAMLKGVKLDEIGDSPFSDFGGLKNLFKNPDEYAKHYAEGRDKFGPLFDRSSPSDIKEFNEIHGGVSKDLAGIPFGVLKDIKALYENREKLEDAIEEMMKQGVEPSVTTKVWNSLDQSGKKVRDMISVLISKDDSPDKIMQTVEKYYPNAVIPHGEKLIEYLYDYMTKKKLRNKNVIDKWNQWSQSQGFYPPNWIAVGNTTSDALLRPQFGRNPDPDPSGDRSIADKAERKA
jgi:hypothetical protein